jgi:hypothetical protein
MRIIAAVEAPEVIKKILDHLGLPSTPPPIRAAHGPPLAEREEFNQLFI